jgi:hypothetical protein
VYPHITQFETIRLEAARELRLIRDRRQRPARAQRRRRTVMGRARLLFH